MISNQAIDIDQMHPSYHPPDPEKRRELEEIILDDFGMPEEVKKVFSQYINDEKVEAEPPVQVENPTVSDLSDKLTAEAIETMQQGLDLYVYKYTFREKKFGFIYYESPKKKSQPEIYFYTGDAEGVIIRRVPQSVLGPNVLGRAFVFAKYIEILETLQGIDYEEVKTHEILHVRYPFEPEEKIRERTRATVPYAKFN